LSATVTKLAISQFLSQQLYYKCTLPRMYAAEMTLLTDNGCCTTTFP